MIRYIGTALASALAVGGAGYNYVTDLRAQVTARDTQIAILTEARQHDRQVVADAIRTLETLEK